MPGAHLQIVFTGVSVAASHTLYGAAVGLDVDHIADLHLRAINLLLDTAAKGESQKQKVPHLPSLFAGRHRWWGPA